MSNTSLQEPPAQRVSSGSVQTLASRPLQPVSDPSASKRVCFYKSGDHKFSGHRMVINGRTFKTFDALLDALSKKVPLPFGVRTITTPRGIHLVKGLDDLHDGGSYVCSDRKRVKPLNLNAVHRRQVPWNTTRPVSAGRRGRQGLPTGQFGRRNEVINRPAKITDRVAVRTPKRLVVIKNRDPTIKHTVVLQRRTAPTFDALLDYLSQIMQFSVLKLFSADGRRVDGLAALILCSGVVIAAGNEPFRLGNHSVPRIGQMAQSIYSDTVEPSGLQPQEQKNKSFSSGRGSRNFSLSSERYIVNQINMSRNGSMSNHLHHHNGSFETDVNQYHTSSDVETCENVRVNDERHACIVPQDDDIEKSFRVNQDGSMTVEMKVRLTIKEEEMLHWTTTLSRSSLSQRPVCASKSGSGNSSPYSNNAMAEDPFGTSEDENKEENHPSVTGKGVGFSPTALEKNKSRFKRTPTPGPRHVKKKASIESVKTVTESGVQESTLGQYTYMERTADGETTEGYCVVRHSSSSSNRPVPKPRKIVSAEASKKGSHSSIRSPGVAEVLQIQNNGMEITETVMHIYESQGCYDNYFANTEYSTEDIPLHGSTPMSQSKPASTISGPISSSNDCDIDFTCQPSTADSLHRRKEEILSLSSEPISPTHEISNNLSSFTDNEARIAANSQTQSPRRGTDALNKDNAVQSEKKKKAIKPSGKHKSSPSTSSSDKKQKDSMASLSKSSKHSSPDKLSNASLGKKTLSSSESDKNGQKGKGKETKKKVSRDDTTPRRKQDLLPNIENVKRPSSKKQMNVNHGAPRDNDHNVNTPETGTTRPPMKKNMLDILQPKRSLLPGKKVITKQKSMNENRTSSPKRTLELSESVSMPSLNPSPSDIHQYVENWLQKVSSDSVPCMEEAITEESEPQTKVVFHIGGDSESEAKSECQANTDEHYSLHGEAVTKSTSCLSVPSTVVLNTEQKAKGLCVSMPSVRVDPVYQESTLRTHTSAEAIGPFDNESSSTSNLLSPKAKIKPAVRQLCSSIHCIRGASESEKPTNLEKSSSLPDFSSQVASVFGSSSKAFLSFLSVMTLRDTLTGSVAGDKYDSESPSEAMLLMESLQKISAVEDEEEQRASLTDLQSRTSSHFRERWKDFQVLRERLESEPLSPKFSEQEFALDVISEGGDAFDDQHLGIDELMEELNMPQDLREEIYSTFQQTKSFYPEVEESTYVEKERDHSDSEEELEQFAKHHHHDETKQSPEPDTTCIAEDIAETSVREDNENGYLPAGETDDFNKMQSIYHEQAKMLAELEHEPDQVQETDPDRKELEETENVEKAEPSKDLENDFEPGLDIDACGPAKPVSRGKGKEEEEEEEEGIDDENKEGVDGKMEEKEEENQVEEVEEYRNEVKDSEDEDTKEIEERDEEIGKGEKERGEEAEEEAVEEEEQELEEEERQKEEEVDNRDDIFVEETDEEGGGKESFEEKEDKWEEVDEDNNEEEREEVVIEKEEEAEGVIGEQDEKEEWNDMVVEETDEEEEGEENEEEGEEGGTEEGDGISEKNEEEDVNEAIGETDEEEQVDEVIEEKDEEGEVEVIIEEKDEEEEDEEEELEEEGEEAIIEEKDEEEEVSEDKDEKEEIEEREEEAGEVVEDQNTEAGEITDEEGEGEANDTDNNINEKEKWDEAEERREKQENEVNVLEEEAIGEEEEEGEESEVDVDMEAEQEVEGEDLAEEVREDEEKQGSELNEGCDQVEEQESKDEEDEENRCVSEPVSADADSIADSKVGKRLLEEAYYLQQSSCEEDQPNYEDTKRTENYVESSNKSSSVGQCEDDKGNGTDTVNELKTDDGEEEEDEERSSSLPHPVEISQELLDFVNSALQSSSLIFTYDARGNIRIEPDNARVIHTKQVIIPKSREDSQYGLKRLPSPCTSDLSDYRPETSDSGGYKTQESTDIATESGEEPSESPSPDCRHSSDMPNGRTNVERTDSKQSVRSKSELLQSSRLKSGGSFSSYDSGTKASREDLSYFSGASSLKIDTEPAIDAAQRISFPSEVDSNDGVLIDQGRWLLKENHLIRKSPPISIGMYGNIDTTSIDTAQENNSEDSPPHTQDNPLAAISSSELEEMAKPQTPKCTYYNMSHGSDSDPFLDDVSVKSGKKDTSSVKGRGLRVSPTIDTSKTWTKKNGSLSSFASVEFKMPDSRVHPEGESSAVTQARRPSGVGGRVLQAQDSLDTLHVRCGQYCPIL